MIATGWGRGGPSVTFHLLWGWLFSILFGFSLTTLRVSVLVLGIAGTFGMFFSPETVRARPMEKFAGSTAPDGQSVFSLSKLFIHDRLKLFGHVCFCSLSPV